MTALDVAAAAVIRDGRTRAILDGLIEPRDGSVFELALRLLALMPRSELALEIRLPHEGLNVQPRPRAIFAWRFTRGGWQLVWVGTDPAAALADALAFHEPRLTRDLVEPIEITPHRRSAA